MKKTLKFVAIALAILFALSQVSCRTGRSKIYRKPPKEQQMQKIG